MSKFDTIYSNVAEAISAASHDPDTKVGCVLVKDNYIIANGYNGTPRGTDTNTKAPSGSTLSVVIHAELNALMYAARSTVSTVGATAYVTHTPCLDCAIHLYQAGIKRVVYRYAHDNPDCDKGAQFLNQQGVKYVRNTGDSKVS